MIRYTLIADGPSDKALMAIINWVLLQKVPHIPVTAEYADFRNNRQPPKDLGARVVRALEYWPCEILFIHRDAEQSRDIDDILNQRKAEIATAVSNSIKTFVPIIPVRMMESWMLTDESAILKAAGNTRGKIELPKLNSLEQLPDPKELLYKCLRQASGLRGRQLKSFNERSAVHLVAEYTNDFTSLRKLKSFQAFELEVEQVLKQLKYM